MTEEFVEPGASATDDRRPVFQRMLEQAREPDRRFDVILVHAFSRFYRNGAEMELTIRSLRKLGVEVVSITQPTGDDPSQEMMRQIIGIFDEYTSKENGKNVTRAMRESAKQGFWNGSTPPLGYRVVEAERRGAKIKKRLEVDPVEAETVRLIYRLYTDGDGTSGPLGVKQTTSWLNRHGYRTRRGAHFGVGPLHRILKNACYATGKWRYGIRNSRTGTLHDPASVVEIEVPTILSLELFERVQRRLSQNSPRVTPPRVVNGPTLLAGLAVCATCGAGMTRTATRRRGRLYSYYSCGGSHQKGKSVCRGRHMPMARLDGLIVDNVKEHLFAGDRLARILDALVERQGAKDQAVQDRRASLEGEIASRDDRLKRLYRAIEEGIVDLDARPQAADPGVEAGAGGGAGCSRSHGRPSPHQRGHHASPAGGLLEADAREARHGRCPRPARPTCGRSSPRSRSATERSGCISDKTALACGRRCGRTNSRRQSSRFCTQLADPASAELSSAVVCWSLPVIQKPWFSGTQSSAGLCPPPS